MPRLRSLGIALLSGVMIGLCWPRAGLCPLGWVALAPLAGLCFKRTPRDCAGLGFAAGFAFHGLVVYWIYNTCRFAHVPGPWASPAVQVASAAAVWAVLAGFLALEWAAAAAASGWLCARSPRALRPWAWALAWTAVSVAAERWTPRLAGDLPAYSQWRYLSLLQIGSIFGPHGLGWLVAAANACVAAAWLELDDGEPSGAAAANLAAVAALIAGAWMYGEWCLVSRPPAGSAARVEILQPDVDQYQKFDENFVERIRGNFIELLSRPRPENPSLVVWPESALPEWVDEGQPVAEAATWSRKLGSYQLVGVVSTDRTHNYNSAFLIGPDAKLRGVYHKRELVPFGEYVPLRFLERYISVLSLMGDLTKGEPRQPLMETPLGPMAVTICYEAMFPRWAQRDASRGARILANVTNDGWYKDTWGPYQHFQSNVYRAVENRVTVIRSGNTGISAVIDPWGVITAKLDLGVRGRLDAAVAAEDFFPRRSFYARHGDWFGTMVLWVTAFWAGFAFWRRPRAA